MACMLASYFKLLEIICLYIEHVRKCTLYMGSVVNRCKLAYLNDDNLALFQKSKCTNAQAWAHI